MRTNSEIISFIKKQMNEYHISGNQLAAATGNAKSTVSRYLNETNEFPINKADDFARVLHTTPEEIIGVEPKQQKIESPTHKYPYLDTEIAAGALTTVDGLSIEDLDSIELSDAVMGNYAGDDDLFVTNVNGESMNRVIPNHSLIVVKQLDSFEDLNDGDIVVFSEDDEDYSMKHFYNDVRSQVFTFAPDSTENNYRPMSYRYEDMGNIRIIGRVVVYVVTL